MVMASFVFKVLLYTDTLIIIISGIQLDSWLMVMVIMDIAPLAWCVFMYIRTVVTESFSSNRSNSRSLTNSSRPVSYTLIEVAEILSLTMKKWSPAYQLNELIMKHVDGCLIGHASCCKLLNFKIIT